MSNVSNLPRPQREPPEHITVRIDKFADELAEELVKAENIGARSAMLIVSPPAKKHMDVLENLEATHEMRARQYAAQLKVMMKGIGG